MTYNSHGKEEMHSSHFGYKRKCITIIKPIYLKISFGHQSSFEALYFTIWPNFNGLNPTTTKKPFVQVEEERPMYHYIQESEFYQSWLVAIQDDQIPLSHL